MGAHKETRHLTKDEAQPTLVKGSLRLYGMKYCPYDQRVKLVLDAKNIPYDSVNINLSSKPGWFLAKGTDGKVPTLELENGTCLAESLIIADYLDEQYPEPALYPKDPRSKALDRLLITKYGSVLNGFYKFLSATEDCYTPDNFKQFVSALLPFEAELAKRGTKFFAGSTPGMLDLMIVPWLERAPVLAAIGGVEFELPADNLPKLLQWRTDMLQVPQVQRSVLPVDAHKRFFLSRTGPNFYDFDYDG